MTEPHVPEQGGTPPPSPAPKKRGNGCITALLVCIIASFVIVGVFIVCTLLSPPTEYKTLDYDAVMRTPNIFKGENAIVEGTLWQILPVSPEADTENIFLQVRERGNEDHIWLVYGPMTADDVLRLEEGMDITARGGFTGVFPITNRIGKEVLRPAVYSLDIEFGYRIGGDQ